MTRNRWVGAVVLAPVLLASSHLPIIFSVPQPKDAPMPGKEQDSCGFLPVAVPGGQGGRSVYVVPEEVSAVSAANANNTTTTIFFRHQHSIQVNAPDTGLLEALQSDRRVRQGKK